MIGTPLNAGDNQESIELHATNVINQLCSCSSNRNELVHILHFNDVYNIEPSDLEDVPAAGLARFIYTLNWLRNKHRNALTLFSGDIISPSTNDDVISESYKVPSIDLVSTITEGQQMVEAMPLLKIDYAVVGNHEFDFGLERLHDMIRGCDSTIWLLSNLYDFDTEEPLEYLHSTASTERQGIKIGMIGLVEEEWIDTLGTLNRDDLLYTDFTDEALRLSRKLKNEGADIVIALTHMRVPNDLLLFDNVKEIDIVLGGHDHEYMCHEENGRLLLKSGSDFRDMSLITIAYDPERGLIFNVDRYAITKDVPEDVNAKKLVDKYIESSDMLDIRDYHWIHRLRGANWDHHQAGKIPHLLNNIEYDSIFNHIL